MDQWFGTLTTETSGASQKWVFFQLLLLNPHSYFLLQDSIELTKVNCHELGKKCTVCTFDLTQFLRCCVANPFAPTSACIVKGKAILLQAWTGPEGSTRLRLPNFKTIGTLRW